LPDSTLFEDGELAGSTKPASVRINALLKEILEKTPVSQVCGLDEVGRGPLAGPVVAGCALLPNIFPYELLDDSKALDHHKRVIADKAIRENAIGWGLGWVWPDKIEELNIHHASLYAMKLAWEDMVSRLDPTIKNKLSVAVIDGKFVPQLPLLAIAQIKGDKLVPQVSAASIVAKIARDAWMDKQALLYPQYGFERHKGYPTPFHKEALKKYGPCPIHRLSWVSRAIPVSS